MSLEDLILPFSYIEIYKEMYIQDPTIDIETNYYVSPLKATDEILRQMPRLRIMVGSRDPLMDDCWRYTERLALLERDIWIKIYKGFPHGAISLCFEGGVEESMEMVNQVSLWISELL